MKQETVNVSAKIFFVYLVYLVVKNVTTFFLNQLNKYEICLHLRKHANDLDAYSSTIDGVYKFWFHVVEKCRGNTMFRLVLRKKCLVKHKCTNDIYVSNSDM